MNRTDAASPNTAGLAILGTLKVLPDAAEHGWVDLLAAFGRFGQTIFRQVCLASRVARWVTILGKVFTGNTDVVTAEVGTLKAEALKRVVDAVVAL